MTETQSPAPSHKDLSSGPDVFAQRLGQAISERGLSLHRLQARLVAVGLKVSTATLSYWASGRSRPTRGGSLDVVRNLEQILQVETGWLVQPLETNQEWDQISDLLPKADLPEELERITRQQAAHWQRLHVHDLSVVDATSPVSHCTTRMVSRAEVEGLDGWTTIVQHAPGESPGVVGVTALEVRSIRSLPNQQLSVIELALPRPLHRGEMVLTEHRTEVHGTQPPTEMGRALMGRTPLLAIEVRFPSGRPEQVQRTHIDPKTGLPRMIDQGIMHTPHGAQCVIPDAAPGSHLLSWEW